MYFRILVFLFLSAIIKTNVYAGDTTRGQCLCLPKTYFDDPLFTKRDSTGKILLRYYDTVAIFGFNNNATPIIIYIGVFNDSIVAFSHTINANHLNYYKPIVANKGEMLFPPNIEFNYAANLKHRFMLRKDMGYLIKSDDCEKLTNCGFEREFRVLLNDLFLNTNNLTDTKDLKSDNSSEDVSITIDLMTKHDSIKYSIYWSQLQAVTNYKLRTILYNLFNQFSAVMNHN